MAEGDRPHSWRRRVLTLLAVLLALAVGAAGAAYWLDLGGRLAGDPDPARDPAAVAPPPGVDLPDPGPALAVAAPLPRGRIAPAAVRRALGRLTEDRRLGRRVSVAVAGIDGRPVHTEGPAVVVPASTLKIVTSLAALAALGPEHRFTTSAMLAGRRLTLVGGGDPLLARAPAPQDEYPERADLAALATQTARGLTERGRTRVRLEYDATLFSGPSASPDWEADYLPDDVVSPITALWVDEGREETGLVFRSDDPAGDAAAVFAGHLRTEGIQVVGAPRPSPAPGNARRVGAVRSAELVEVVQHVLQVSDNEGAEVLARHVALATGEPGSFAGAVRAVRRSVEELGVSMAGAVIQDGSGLSRGNRLSAPSLLDAMSVALDPARPELAGAVSGLPVAGFSGSLTSRFAVRAQPGLGRVRAKTGTLTGVHGLSGVVAGRDGSVMTFVAIADRVAVPNTLFARARLDQVAAALAGCRCGRR